MAEIGRGLRVLVIGADRDPTTALLEDVRRLNYLPELMVWPAERSRSPGRAVVATIVDFRALGVHAERACRALQEDRILRRAPVIALVFEQEGSRLDLSLGFDDLILAPYRLSELAARLRLVRWRAESGTDPAVLRVGPLILNPATYEVRLERTPLDLTLKEYQLLLFLMRNPGRVFTREQLLDHVWGHDYYGGTRTVDVHIRRLRAKTEAVTELFETVRGVGYRLVASISEAAR